MVTKRIWNSSSFIAWVVSCAVLTYVTFNQFKWRDGNVLSYDVAYYYLFLPSALIYHDLGKLEFYPAKVNEYNISFRQPTYELYLQKTGRVTNKYAVGVAACELPFFSQLMRTVFCPVLILPMASRYPTGYVLFLQRYAGC